MAKKQATTKHKVPSRSDSGLVRNVKAYAASRLERRSDYAKQSSQMLGAFQRAYGRD